MNLRDIIEATAGKLLRGSLDVEVLGISIDTRTIKQGELFLAIKGERHDGHDFIKEAVQKGATAVIVENETSELKDQNNCDVSVIRVTDTLKALGDIANWWRRQTGPFLIAITGSSGKTTTKELLSSILSMAGNTYATIENMNNQIGVPINILKITKDHKYAIVEMGMNKPGEIGRLTEISDPDFGVITNVGRAHLEGLGSLQNVVLAKLELISKIRPNATVLIDGDNDTLLTEAKKFNRNLITIGHKKENDYVVAIDTLNSKGNVKIFSKKQQTVYDFTLNIPGYPYLRNAATACCVALCLGLTPDLIQKGLNTFKGVKRRFEIIKIYEDSYLVDDSYNANPDSLKTGLTSLKQLFPAHFIVLVLGDMLELGEESNKLHQEAGRLCAKLGFASMILIGEYAGEIMKGAVREGLSQENIKVIPKAEDALELLPKYIRPKSVIYLKGSHKVNISMLSDFIIENYKNMKEI